MKKSFLIVIIGMLSLGMSMNSCSSDDEDETDSRDQYVGAWVMVTEGSINYLVDGSIDDTETVNDTRSVNISKSGENDLLIDERIYFVNGFTLTSNPLNTTNDSGTVIFTTTGVISSDSCTLVSDVTGDWSSEGVNGTYSGTLVQTLTK
jgi:hypothetical protein